MRHKYYVLSNEASAPLTFFKTSEALAVQREGLGWCFLQRRGEFGIVAGREGLRQMGL